MPAANSILNAAVVAQWPAQFISKLQILEIGALIVSTTAAWFASMALTDPGDSVHVVSGRIITKNPADIEAELAKTGALDGIRINPRVRISKNRERQHGILLGQSGAGKTQILLPMMQQAMDRGDRVLTYDYKGDFTENTGDDVAIIAPWDARSWAWDISVDVLNKQDAETLAAGLIVDGSDDPFWSSGARAILVGIIASLQAEKGQDWGFADIAKIIISDIDALQSIMIKYHPQALKFLKEESTTTDSLEATLASFAGPIFSLADAWGQTDSMRRVSFRRWMTDPAPHYPRSFILQGSLAYEPLMKSYMQGILRVVQQTVGSAELRAIDNGIWIFLDECFCNLASSCS